MENPVFVVGSVHSGTTLLQRILGSSPSMYVGKGESQFFAKLAAIRKRHPDLSTTAGRTNCLRFLANIATTGYSRVNDKRSEQRIDLAAHGIDSATLSKIASSTNGTATHEQLFLRVMGTLATANDCSRWLEKTPAHLFHAEQILRLLPEAKFVEMVRDPRSVLASKKRRGSQEYLQRFSGAKRARKQRLTSAFNPVIDSVIWRGAEKAGRRVAELKDTAILRIRYEDLVSAPEATVRQICRFADLEFNPEMLNVGWVNASSDRTQRPEHAATNNSATGERPDEKSIGDAAVSSWRSDFRDEELMAIEKINSKRMRSLGYEPESTTSWWSTTMLSLLLKSGFDSVMRLVRSYRLGGGTALTSLVRRYYLRLAKF